MRNDQPKQLRVSKAGLLASIAIHALVAALVLPLALFSPQKEEKAIEVELVHAPPKTKGEASPPAGTSQPEKPADTSANPPPQASDSPPQARQAPVFRFGDKDRGPQKSAGGSAAETASPPATVPPQPVKQEAPQTPAVTATPAPNQVAPAAARPASVKQDPSQTPAATTPPRPDLRPLPQGWAITTMPLVDQSIMPAVTTPTPTPQVPPNPSSSKVPTPQATTQTQQGLNLHAATSLYSQNATLDVSSMMAISKSRGERGGELCKSELQAQLIYGSPSYLPEALPLYRLQDGATVIESPKDAFQANSQWYALSYRCEVDAQATKVVNFALRVGDPIPRSQWQSLGLVAH